MNNHGFRIYVQTTDKNTKEFLERHSVNGTLFEFVTKLVEDHVQKLVKSGIGVVPIPPPDPGSRIMPRDTSLNDEMTELLGGVQINGDTPTLEEMHKQLVKLQLDAAANEARLESMRLYGCGHHNNNRRSGKLL